MAIPSIPQSKMCTTCLKEKSLNSYTADLRAKDGKQACCRKCYALKANLRYAKEADKIRALGRANYARNPRKFIDRGYKNKYGISAKDKEKMIAAQNGCCFICKNTLVTACIDHNHKSGAIRKILCVPCNTALGMIKENFDIALSLAKYIQEDQRVI